MFTLCSILEYNDHVFDQVSNLSSFSNLSSGFISPYSTRINHVFEHEDVDVEIEYYIYVRYKK